MSRPAPFRAALVRNPLRRLCPACKQAHEPTRLERRLLRLEGDDARRPIFRPRGCPKCDQTGYRGRLALMEMLRFDPDVDEIVARRGTARAVLST